MKQTLLLLMVSLALPACAGTGSSTVQPGETAIPTPASALVDSFLWQTDGQFGYGMLRPANWEALSAVDSRDYAPPGSRDQDDRIVLRALNLKAYYGSATSESGLNATLFAFEQDPTLDGWTAGIEQMWQSDNIEFSLLRTLSQAKIYTVSQPGSSDVYLIAYAVDQDQPLALSLVASGAYANEERLQEEGILDDFVLMVSSAQAVPQDPANVEPPLD